MATEHDHCYLQNGGWSDYQLALALFEQTETLLPPSFSSDQLYIQRLFQKHQYHFFRHLNPFCVDLSHNDLTAVGIMLYCEAIIELNLPIRNMDFSHNRIDDKVISIVIRFLQSLAGQYKGLLLTKENAGEWLPQYLRCLIPTNCNDESEPLSKTWFNKPSWYRKDTSSIQLESIDLSHNFLHSSEGLRQLLQTVMDTNVLSRLFLSSNHYNPITVELICTVVLPVVLPKLSVNEIEQKTELWLHGQKLHTLTIGKEFAIVNKELRLSHLRWDDVINIVTALSGTSLTQLKVCKLRTIATAEQFVTFMERLTELTQLQSLDLTNCFLNDTHWLALSTSSTSTRTLYHMTMLKLCDNNFSKESVSSIMNWITKCFPQLTSLDVTENLLCQQSCQHIVNACKQAKLPLTELKLGMNVDVFQNTNTPSMDRHGYIVHCIEQVLGDIIANQEDQGCKLTEIFINRNVHYTFNNQYQGGVLVIRDIILTSTLIDTIVRLLRTRKNVKGISIIHCQCTDSQLQQFVTLLKPIRHITSSLVKLNLSHNCLSDSGIQSLLELLVLTDELKVLQLSRNLSISDTSIHSLIHFLLTKIPSIEIIQLHCIELRTDTIARIIMEILQLPVVLDNLIEINLNQILFKRQTIIVPVTTPDTDTDSDECIQYNNKLIISDTDFTESDLRVIGNGLMRNTVIDDFSFSNCSLDSNGIHELITAFSYNVGLVSFSCYGREMHIDKTVGYKLLNAICNNSMLQYLRFNPIEAEEQYHIYYNITEQPTMDKKTNTSSESKPSEPVKTDYRHSKIYFRESNSLETVVLNRRWLMTRRCPELLSFATIEEKYRNTTEDSISKHRHTIAKESVTHFLRRRSENEINVEKYIDAPLSSFKYYDDDDDIPEEELLKRRQDTLESSKTCFQTVKDFRRLIKQHGGSLGDKLNLDCYFHNDSAWIAVRKALLQLMVGKTISHIRLIPREDDPLSALELVKELLHGYKYCVETIVVKDVIHLYNNLTECVVYWSINNMKILEKFWDCILSPLQTRLTRIEFVHYDQTTVSKEVLTGLFQFVTQFSNPFTIQVNISSNVEYETLLELALPLLDSDACSLKVLDLNRRSLYITDTDLVLSNNFLFNCYAKPLCSLSVTQDGELDRKDAELKFSQVTNKLKLSHVDIVIVHAPFDESMQQIQPQGQSQGQPLTKKKALGGKAKKPNLVIDAINRCLKDDLKAGLALPKGITLFDSSFQDCDGRQRGLLCWTPTVIQVNPNVFDLVKSIMHKRPTLNQLSLSNTLMDASQLQLLVESLSTTDVIAKRLIGLHISNNPLGQDSIDSLQNILKYIKSLTQLSLANTNLNDAACMRVMETVISLPTLAKLQLHSSPLCSERQHGVSIDPFLVTTVNLLKMNGLMEDLSVVSDRLYITNEMFCVSTTINNPTIDQFKLLHRKRSSHFCSDIMRESCKPVARSMPSVTLQPHSLLSFEQLCNVIRRFNRSIEGAFLRHRVDSLVQVPFSQACNEGISHVVLCDVSSSSILLQDYDSVILVPDASQPYNTEHRYSKYFQFPMKNLDITKVYDKCRFLFSSLFSLDSMNIEDQIKTQLITMRSLIITMSESIWSARVVGQSFNDGHIDNPCVAVLHNTLPVMQPVALTFSAISLVNATWMSRLITDSATRLERLSLESCNLTNSQMNEVLEQIAQTCPCLVNISFANNWQVTHVLDSTIKQLVDRSLSISLDFSCTSFSKDHKVGGLIWLLQSNAAIHKLILDHTLLRAEDVIQVVDACQYNTRLCVLMCRDLNLTWSDDISQSNYDAPRMHWSESALQALFLGQTIIKSYVVSNEDIDIDETTQYALYAIVYYVLRKGWRNGDGDFVSDDSHRPRIVIQGYRHSYSEMSFAAFTRNTLYFRYLLYQDGDEKHVNKYICASYQIGEFQYLLSQFRVDEKDNSPSIPCNFDFHVNSSLLDPSSLLTNSRALEIMEVRNQNQYVHVRNKCVNFVVPMIMLHCQSRPEKRLESLFNSNQCSIRYFPDWKVAIYPLGLTVDRASYQPSLLTFNANLLGELFPIMEVLIIPIGDCQLAISIDENVPVDKRRVDVLSIAIQKSEYGFRNAIVVVQKLQQLHVQVSKLIISFNGYSYPWVEMTTLLQTVIASFPMIEAIVICQQQRLLPCLFNKEFSCGISIEEFRFLNGKVLGGIIDLLNSTNVSNRNRLFHDLTLTEVTHDRVIGTMMNSKEFISLCDAILGCSSMVSLTLNLDYHENGIDALTKLMQHSHTLKRVDISGKRWDGRDGDKFRILVTALANNKLLNLHELQLGYCQLNEYQDILDLEDGEWGDKTNAEILSYIRLKTQGSRIVKRCKLMLVGDGAAGKTTLVHRLKHNSFNSDPGMTDGIIMSNIVIDDVQFNVMDFAGQEEYAHTHGLFFSADSAFLAVHNPRSSGSLTQLIMFLQMVVNCASAAPILLVTTRADEQAFLPAEQIEYLKSLFPNIQDVVAVDSKSGTGIDKLQRVLGTLPCIRSNNVPESYFKLMKCLDDFTQTKVFSVTYNELCRLSKSSFGIDDPKSCIDLLVGWGEVYRLSDGQLVLRPQELAEVLSCVFSKREDTQARIGQVKDGILIHDTAVLQAIWGERWPDPTLWTSEGKNGVLNDAPFVALLHSSGLAYKLYDTQGKSLNSSLIPAKLPDKPSTSFPFIPETDDASLDGYIKQVISLFLSDTGSPVNMNYLILRSSLKLPVSLFGQLQVKLRSMAMLGGAWRYGCALHVAVEKHGTKRDSYAILLVRETSLVVVSAGKSTAARGVVLTELVSLIHDHFSSLQWKDMTLYQDGCVFARHQIRESIASGVGTLSTRIDPQSGRMRSVNTTKFAILFDDLPTLPPVPDIVVSPRAKPLSSREASMRKALRGSISVSVQSVALPPEWVILEETLSKYSNRSDEEDDSDVVEVSHQFQRCISSFMELFGFRCRKRGLRTLWLVVIDSSRYNNKQKENVTSTVPYLQLIAVSPGLNAAHSWSIVDKGSIYVDERVLVPQSSTSISDRNRALLKWLLEAPKPTETDDPMLLMHKKVFSLLEETMSFLGIGLPRHHELCKVALDLSLLQSPLLHAQQLYFDTYNGLLVDKQLLTKAQGMTKTKHFEEGFEAWMVNTLTTMTQQMDVHNRKLDEVHQSVQSLDAGFRSSMLEIRSSIQENGSILRSMRMEWKQQVTDLESIVSNHSTMSTQVLESKLKEFFEINSARMCGGFDSMKTQIQALESQFISIARQQYQEQMNVVAKATTNKDKQFEELLNQMRQVQAQMTEVLKVSNELRGDIKQSTTVLRSTIVNIHQRTFPTSFVLVDGDHFEKKEPVPAENVNEQKKSKLEIAQDWSNRIGQRMMPLMDALLMPVTTTKQAIQDALRNEEYLSLICELCRCPQPHMDGTAGYRLTKPKEVVGKVLPLAKAGMKLIYCANAVSSVGRVFGLPTPVLSNSTLDATSEFIDELDKNTLDPFPELQKKVSQCYGEKQKDSVDVEGYCLREFKRLLQSLDPEETWCGLVPRVLDDGDVLFICSECVNSCKQ